MVRANPRHADHRWDAHERRPPSVITYFVGTVGVAIVLAVSVIAAQDAGLLDSMHSALRQIEFRSLLRAPQTGLDIIVQELAREVGKIEQSTTALWQRVDEPQQLNQTRPPEGAHRRK